MKNTLFVIVVLRRRVRRELKRPKQWHCCGGSFPIMTKEIALRSTFNESSSLHRVCLKIAGAIKPGKNLISDEQSNVRLIH